MSLKNISGTTMPAFKIGSKGVQLISQAVIKNGETLNKFKVRDSEGVHEVRYRDQDNELYDTFIESSDIKRITYSLNSLKLYLRDGTEIDISKVINTSDIETPDTTVDKEVVLFGGTSGKKLVGSGFTLTDDPDEINTLDNVIPTSVAVRGYLVRPLKDRLRGNGVSDGD